MAGRNQADLDPVLDDAFAIGQRLELPAKSSP